MYWGEKMDNEELLIFVSRYMIENGMKKETAERSIRNIKYFLNNGGLDDPTGWFIRFMDRDISSAYKYQMYYSVKWYLKFKGVEWEFKRPKHNRNVRCNLTIEKCAKLLGGIEEPEHKLMVEIALLTGMRPSEVLSLKIDDVDGHDSTIRIKNTKTYIDREIPISRELCAKLQMWAEGKKITGRFFPYKSDWFAKIVRSAAKKGGFVATPYMLRHTFATQYVENGGNIMVLKKIMGHSDIKTTEGYIHESKGMMRKDYERARPRLFV